MRVHHLNCGAMCPLGGRIYGPWSNVVGGRLGCHCLLVEHESGLILVDTGFGLGDIEKPLPRLSGFFYGLCRPKRDAALTAARQIEAMGFRREDVRHIVLTHLDFDHAGGLEDFPEAVVHTLAPERAAAELRQGFIAERRYRPDQWDGVRTWRTYRADGGDWFGFRAVRDLDGLPPEILLVPLAGHTVGHAGVAVEGPEGWMLLAGDAYFHHGELEPRRRCPVGLRAYQTMMEVDRDQRFANQQRLRELKQTQGLRLRIFSSHDPAEYEALAGRARG
jgi:glyoxylase-like metal-dependent hydrolase (beta-lactamase superfamily II)